LYPEATVLLLEHSEWFAKQFAQVCVRLEVPTAVKIKIIAFRDVTPCSLVDRYHQHSKQPAASFFSVRHSGSLIDITCPPDCTSSHLRRFQNYLDCVYVEVQVVLE
jgi:hypothetical protein